MSGRSIAPRPAQHPETPTAGTQPEPSRPDQTQDVAGTSTRKKVTSACQGCQKRRVKCDGNHPCATCIRTKTECSYTPELDGRSIKRKYHEVQRDQELLNDLLETIRYTKDEQIHQIISLIRSDATMEDIKSSVAQRMKDMQLTGREPSPELKQLQTNLSLLGREVVEQTRPPQRPDFLEIRRLADKPLYRVPASPWTNVTTDDDLVSNLVSAYISWDKGWQDWVDEDLFITAMQAASVDSPFCSPFLVNCLLAWACPYSDYKEARTVNGNVSQLMLEFIAEAKRLLEDETASGLCMTTIQGLLVLHGAMAVAGHDKSGYRYMLQGMGLTQDLMVTFNTLKPQLDAQMIKDCLRSIDRTMWGVFISTTQYLVTVLKPQTMMRPPRRPRPLYQQESTSPRMWRPYQFEDDPVPSYRDELFDFGCDLGIIEAQISQTLFDVEQPFTREETENRLLAVFHTLQHQIGQLPLYLRPRLGSCPSLFSQQIRIQATMLRIFMALRENHRDSSPEVVAMAKVKCIEAAMETAQVVKLYMQSWGPPRLGVMICHPVFVSVSILLEEQNLVIYASHITDMCVGLRAMSRRWPIVMAMLRMLQLEARNKGWELPADTNRLFEEFERSAWKQRELKRFGTNYPKADATKSANPVSDGDMGTFLEQMDNLVIEDPEVDSDIG